MRFLTQRHKGARTQSVMKYTLRLCVFALKKFGSRNKKPPELLATLTLCVIFVPENDNTEADAKTKTLKYFSCRSFRPTHTNVGKLENQEAWADD
jgi:hypothetical protein